MPSWKDRAKKVEGVAGSWRSRAKTEEEAQSDVERERKIAEDKPGLVESAIRGGAQGFTFGLADELTANAGAIRDTMGALLGTRGDISYGEAYRTHRDAIRRRDDKAKAANPKTFTTAEIGTGVASTLLPGGALLNSGKGAKTAAVMAKGAGAGGLTGLGKSEAELTDGSGVPEALYDTAVGAGTGAITAGALKKIGDKFSSDNLRKAADRRFYKGAVGRQAGFDKKLTDKQREELGRYLRDKVKVKGGDAPKNILAKLQDRKGVLSEKYDEIYKEFGDNQIVDGTNIATKIRKLAEEIKSPNSANSGAYKNLMRQADEFEAMGYLPMEEAKRLRGTYKFELGDPSSMALGKANTQRINRIIGEEMDSGVEALSKSGGSEDLVSRFRDLQSEYAKNKTLMDPTKELADRFGRNRTLGLTDYMTGLGGFAAGDPTMGIATAAANRVVRERGSTAVAAISDRLSKALAKGPEAFGPFYPILKQAAERGGPALGVTHYLLSKDVPEYRELIKRQGFEP